MSVLDGFTPWPEWLRAEYRKRGYWRGVSLGAEFRAQVGRAPARPALIAETGAGVERWTYGELGDAVELLAAELAARGVHGGARIVVQLPNVAEFVVLTLACLRVGAVPVMALPQHRRAEINHLLELSEAVGYAIPAEHRGFDHLGLAEEMREQHPSLRHVLVVGPPRETSSRPDTDLAALCRLSGDVAAASAVVDEHSPTSDEVAVLLLSGGTTGRPKSIPRTHDDYNYNIRISAEICDLNEKSVYLVAIPAGHNFPLACPGILGALLRGGTVVMAESPAPDTTFPLIEQHRVTHSAVVPAVAHRWAEAAAGTEHDLSSLRELAVGGSRLVGELSRRVEAALGVTVQQAFGMAEGLINFTALDDPDEVRHETQGRPLSPGDEIRIVDETEADVPQGQLGELITQGPYTIRGYYRAPEQNAHSFTRDGWYRTGDVVRRTRAGDLIVEGRIKDIINRGGEKVSAEDVENLAYGHPAVANAAAVAVPDPVLGERVCLFVVARDGVPVTLNDLREHMTTSGAAVYKLPEFLHVVPTLPVTKVGKIDKAALRGTAAQLVESQS
jgi:salicylate---CoA ligase